MQLGLCARDIATKGVVSAELKDSAFETLCWMKCNGFDVAPVGGELAQIIVAADIGGPLENTPVSSFAQCPPPGSIYPASLGLEETFDLLAIQPWFLIQDSGRLAGIVTRDDLTKPASSVFVFAYLTQLERSLRRLSLIHISEPTRPY